MIRTVYRNFLKRSCFVEGESDTSLYKNRRIASISSAVGFLRRNPEKISGKDLLILVIPWEMPVSAMQTVEVSGTEGAGGDPPTHVPGQQGDYPLPFMRSVAAMNPGRDVRSQAGLPGQLAGRNMGIPGNYPWDPMVK